MEAGAAKQRTVIIVDDHKAVRQLCRIGLEAAGLRVIEAEDGAEAMERIRRDRPNLILLDIMMPRLTGWDVAAQLLNEPSTNDIPIIFISALTGLHERKRASDLGAYDYLNKPLDPAELAKTVTEALDRIERGDRESLLAETFGRAVG
ncbi:MAG TPA: response regulator [Gaiellaceae bacterium]|nr:response regulator [Gaiellaceae bacterium]